MIGPALPTQGISLEELKDTMAEARDQSATILERGDITYVPGASVLRAARTGFDAFFESNPIYGDAFPAVGRFTSDIIQTSAELFHAPQATGTLTSGGTESILLAVKGARDLYAQRNPGDRGEILVVETAHPAFWRGAQLFGLDIVSVPLNGLLQVDVEEYAAAVTDRTALMVGSAPSYSTGVVDPIRQMAEGAARHGIPFHVDGCMGGWFLPFAERVGASVAMPDFRIEGVTTISADLHKYGYASTKGVSVLLTRTEELKRLQGFEFRTPAGELLYETEGLLGSRPGGPIAAAWSVLRHLGQDGFEQRTRETLELMGRVVDAIEQTDGLELAFRPHIPLIAYRSDEFDVFSVATGLRERGWAVHADTYPIRLLRSLWPWGLRAHIDRFVTDLGDVAALAAQGRLEPAAHVAY